MSEEIDQAARDEELARPEQQPHVASADAIPGGRDPRPQHPQRTQRTDMTPAKETHMPTDTPPMTPAPTEAPLTGAQKSAATALRNRQAARAEKLRDIQSQIDEGTLVVRYLD